MPLSSAKPKVADYPFTTLYPNLGVVTVGPGRSFVMADIPGLIEGAADGAGLGIRFLKHLQRTRVLLHLVDIAPPDPAADPVKDARMIVAELKRFSADLAAKERWLLINKIDLVPPPEADSKARQIVRALRYKGPHFLISAATGEGTRELCQAVMTFLEAQDRQERERASSPEDAGAAPPGAASRGVGITGAGMRTLSFAFITASLHCTDAGGQGGSCDARPCCGG